MAGADVAPTGAVWPVVTVGVHVVARRSYTAGTAEHPGIHRRGQSELLDLNREVGGTPRGRLDGMGYRSRQPPDTDGLASSGQAEWLWAASGPCPMMGQRRASTDRVRRHRIGERDEEDPSADHALTTAIELAKACKATVGVVSVVPIHPGRVPIDPWDDRAVHAEQLRRAKTILAEAGIEPQLTEGAGPPAVVIEDVAERDGYDTIVIGSRGLNAISRILQGSVSEHVATHAKGTVVIAR